MTGGRRPRANWARRRRLSRAGLCAAMASLVLPSLSLAAPAASATWKLSSLKADTKYATSALFSSNSKGTQTWSASQQCSVKGSTVTTTTKAGTCKLTVKIAKWGKYAATTASKTLTVTAPVASTTTVPRTTTTAPRPATTTTAVPPPPPTVTTAPPPPATTTTSSTTTTTSSTTTTTTVPTTTTTSTTSSTTTTTSTTTSTSTTTTTIASANCPSANFPDLSSVVGAGAGYAKPVVTATCKNGNLVVTSNGMIGYAFVKTTPNDLGEQDYTWRVTASPAIAASTTSIRNVLGTLGFTVTGLPVYGPTENPTDNYGDPVYNNLLDSCKGHPTGQLEYHYHAILATNACYLNRTVIGYANDGFPIYSNPGYTYKSGYAMTGNPRTAAWDAYTYSAGDANTLDECNGRTDSSGNYGYYITETFPYILGCFKGTPGNQIGRAAMPMVMSSNYFLCALPKWS